MDVEAQSPAGPVSGRRRVAAGAAVAGLAAMVVMLAVVVVTSWWAVLTVGLSLALVVAATVRVAVFDAGRRRRWLVAGLVGAAGLVVGLVGVALSAPVAALGLIGLGAAVVVLGAYASRGYVRRAAAPPVTGPRHDLAERRSVLFLNPASGGGKVGEFDLVAEARRRGVETVVLGPDDDLTALARHAVADGVQVLGMAGGDGSQADVAAVAAAHDLPFVCVPAGTRNHFALDLGLDRADPRGALDAFVEGIERLVDHGLVGDRFFVNNVSLGIYPHVVQDPAYRDGRLKAAASIVPALVADDGPSIDLRFTSPTGRRYETAQVLLVSNNPYRGLGPVDGAGCRVSLTGGVLGVLVIAASDGDELAAAAQQAALGTAIDDIDGLDQWIEPELVIDSDAGTVLAGVDGEAMELATPLTIRIVPGGLRVMVPVGTPEPSAPMPSLVSVDALGRLLDIAGGVAPGPFGDDS